MKMKSVTAVFLVLALQGCLLAQDEEGRKIEAVDPSSQISYEEQIEPIFRKNCQACHNKSETEGELILESAESILEGGDSGPAIIPGNADESLLFQLAAHRTEPVMPPVDNEVGAKPLSPRDLGLLKLWIDQGAKFEEEAAEESIEWKKVPASYAQIFALEMSPDGRSLAAGRGNELVVYSVTGKRELQRLVDPAIAETHPDSAHLDIVQSLAWSPDGRTLVSGGYRCIKVWQRYAPTLTAVQADAEVLGDDLGQVVDSLVNAEGTRLVALVADGEQRIAKLVELPSRKVLKEISDEHFVNRMTLPFERQVGLSQERLKIAKADVEAAKKRKEDDEKNAKKNEDELKKAEEEVPKRKETYDKAAEDTKKKQAELKTVEELVTKLKKDVETAADDVKKAKQQDELKQQEAQLKAKKDQLAKAKEAEKKRRQEFEGAEKVVTLARESIERAKKAVSLREEELASAEAESADFVQRSEAAKAKLQDAREQSSENRPKLAVLGRVDDWHFAVACDKGPIATYSFDSGALLDIVDDTKLSAKSHWKLAKIVGYPDDASVFADRITSLAFSNDGSTLAVGGGEPSRTGEVQLWSTHDWTQLGVIENAHSDVVYDLQFSPQDDTLASCGSDRMMKTIDPKAIKPLRSFEGHTGHVLGVSWKADGRTLATAGADKVVKVWDAKEGTQKKTVSGFKSEVTSVRFLGLEDRFVFATGDGKVESRDSGGNGKPSFGGFSDYVHKVTCSQDGSVVAAAGQDLVVRVWNAKGELQVEFKQ